MDRGDDSVCVSSIESAAAAAPAGGSQSFDHATVRSDTADANQCVSIQQMDGSQLVGVPVEVAPSAGEKRKRGRPPRGQTAGGGAVAARPPPPKRRKEEEEDEDVCFICFDGGSLVLCDRKGCPKAYHPACIKRDEAFFRSKAKWNCGWHICSVCQKASHFMCYTCTYSLCKGCTRNTDYVCVRGNMGFCTTCMRTIMLIENKEQANKESVQVDFDDQMSWEYLFKVYWVILKEKLSLTLEELTQAKSPCKEVSSVARKQQLPHAQHFVNNSNGFISNGPSGHQELEKPKEVKESLNKDYSSLEKLSDEKMAENTRTVNSGPREWASKELLDFVAHMKNGDASVLSQFDVQALLLEYIKKNNLRDPHRKSEIICDLRLKNLFGKPRVGHIEMLKLLEFHFLIKEDSQKNAFIPAGHIGPLATHFGSDGNNENSLLANKSKRRKSRKRVEERTPQNNLDEYAAIDVHNINLIYLRRNFMENLTDDQRFPDKVVGSIVRVRISTNDQKQDLYRLVQVVGTRKVDISYKIGEKTVDLMLEVLNLDKKEPVAIDTLSNQDFSEDECRRLRQSIRCGLVRRLTVGEIQKKAMELQAVRLKDRLEAEILKLNHLRDRASEKGHKKELRECVEKLQLLKTPEERQRRLCEIPDVHADPKMSPDCDSDENARELVDKSQDEYVRQKYSGFNRSGNRSSTSKIKGKEDGTINSHFRSDNSRDTSGSSDQAVIRTGPESSTATVASESPMATLASGSPFSSNSSETDKLWHYRDPYGKVQGPFSMLQLRKWSTTGYFPNDMKIWINNEQDDSVLLTDALNGHFHAAADLLFNLSLPREEVGATSDHKTYDSDVQGNEKGSSPQSSSIRFQSKDKNESAKNDGSGSVATDCDTSVSFKEMLTGDSQPREPSKDNDSCTAHPPVSHQLPPIDACRIRIDLSQPAECQGSEVSKPHEGQDTDAAAYQITDRKSHENHANNNSCVESSQQSRIVFPINLNSSEVEVDMDSCFSPLNKSGSPEQNGDINLTELPSPTPRVNEAKSEGHAAEKSHRQSSDTHAQASDIPDVPSFAPRHDLNQGGQAAESKQMLPFEFFGQDSSRASTPVVSGAQLTQTANEWGGFSSANAKLAVEEWSSLVSVCSLKQPGEVGDHDTPTSNVDPLAPTTSHPAWHGVVEPIEFSTLAEESVSDLLAEVDAMESQNGLPSPTSAMRCGDDMLKGCKNDCFSPLDDLNLTLDPERSDALSSTDMQHLPCRSTVADEPVGVSRADAYDTPKRSSGHSSNSEGETKLTYVPTSEKEPGVVAHPPPPPLPPPRTMGRGNTAGTGVEAMGTGHGRVSGHVNLDWGASPQGVMNTGWATSQGISMPWAAPSINRGGPGAGGGPVWDSQRRYSGERYPGPSRDWASQRGDSGHGRDRPFWNRQPVGGGGGGSGGGGSGGYSRPPSRGQRVCKFYESGRCKKGASCDYLHP